MKSQPINEFIRDLRDELLETQESLVSREEIEDYLVSNTDCIFIWSAITGEMIYRRGFYNLLGFDDKIMTLERFVSYIHPEDVEYVKRIGQVATIESLKRPQENKKWILHVAHRIQKADNTYTRILAQSIPFSFDNNMRITQFLVKLKDISFANWSSVVDYDFHHPGLDDISFHRSVFSEIMNLFSPKEIEIIKLINEGKNSQQIAEKLNISKHTVATHRKNIMKKSGCHSSKELIQFCMKNGFFIS